MGEKVRKKRVPRVKELTEDQMNRLFKKSEEMSRPKWAKELHVVEDTLVKFEELTGVKFKPIKLKIKDEESKLIMELDEIGVSKEIISDTIKKELGIDRSTNSIKAHIKAKKKKKDKGKVKEEIEEPIEPVEEPVEDRKSKEERIRAANRKEPKEIKETCSIEKDCDLIKILNRHKILEDLRKELNEKIKGCLNKVRGDGDEEAEKVIKAEISELADDIRTIIKYGDYK